MSHYEKTKQFALKIVRFSKINDLKAVEINFPLVERLYCPADGIELQTICTLFGNKGTQRMRVGACDGCGYIGYIDYPSEKWLHAFYYSQWARAVETDIIKEVNRRKRMSKKQIDADRVIRTVKLDKFLKHHPLGKDKHIFEIGCGYGQSLAYLKEQGYKVAGCENSAYRAGIARKTYRLSVANVPFEDASLQRKLRLSRFSLIFSQHVLEHVYDPRAMIRLSSELQSEGDYIIVAVPDVYTEPSLMTLLYIAHPNAFTKQSLATLLQSHAYELVDDFSDQEELYLVGRRVRHPIRIKKKQKHYRDRSIEKFTTVLGLGKKYFMPFRRLWCFRPLGYDHGGQAVHWEFAERITGRWYRAVAHKLLMLYFVYRYGHFESYIACIVKDVQLRYSTYRESPLEIQFEGNIVLLTK